MRILYVSADTGIEVTGRKGASTHIRETCRQLVRRGHEVILVTPCAGKSADHEFEVVVIEPVRAKWVGADLRYVLLNRRIAKLLPSLIERYQPDAVYERYALYQSATQRIAAQLNLPRILEVNSMLSEEMSHRLRFARWAARAERDIWSSARAIICVSLVLQQRILKSIRERVVSPPEIVISPVGVDPEEFRPDVDPIDWSAWGLHGKRIIGYAGTLTRWHGIDLLFEAAKLLQQTIPDACIVVIGGEPEKVAQLRERAWKAGVGDHLRFLGSFPHREIPRLLAGMKACVIPDTQDWSSPTKYFEMAASCRPVVAAHAPAIEEVVGGHGVGALLFQRGNAADLIEKLGQILSDPQLADNLGRQARQRILDHYTWDSNIARILKLYQEQGAPLSNKDLELVTQYAEGNT